ncbi:NYN domain-containing protein [Nocardioides humilatus]|uniref:NYN domain-containing protein n=1 Tax=Nocardioides humilatus TaxID=2607660 RepID=A0A5B1LLW5_9ACTN|nr:NYN domain-containing protein [Nocardioides humilatus]KAA1421765.1 NYN domain-containing protein [Nocardioides humilatus]
MSGTEPRVAIYIDFDNLVISRLSQVKKTGASATVAIDVLLDFATRYGRLTISRAYADWSVKKNADYRDQLVARAVELVQLFPASKTKNGADIRLAVDAIEDLYLHDDLTHVVIAAGDSDFVPLAQRARRLGRVVLGVGMAGSISKTLASACDVYVDYDELLKDREALELVSATESPALEAPAVGSKTPEPAKRVAAEKRVAAPSPRRAYPLLVEAMRGLAAQDPDAESYALSALKNQVLRIYPAFKESDYEAASFSRLLGRYGGHIEVKDNRARLRATGITEKADLP